jgi:hypothetical protein
MFTRAFFSFSPKRHLLRLSLSIFAVLALFLCSFTSLLISYAKQSHGCAPDTPPTLPGTPTPESPLTGTILLNEILSQPHSTWNCSEPSGVYTPAMDSWIELYNASDRPVDLYAVHARISLDGGSNWYYLPIGAEIAPNGFLVVFPAKELQDAPASWSVIQLSFANILIDQVNVPLLSPDQSYARIPDGSKDWQLVGQPTIDASNNLSNQSTTPTARPTPTGKSQATSTVVSGNESTGSEKASTPISSGTEPAWNQVRLPPGTTPPAQTPMPIVPNNLPQPDPVVNEGGLDGPHIALISIIALLLLAALAWCWRLFRMP